MLSNLGLMAIPVPFTPQISDIVLLLCGCIFSADLGAVRTMFGKQHRGWSRWIYPSTALVAAPSPMHTSLAFASQVCCDPPWTRAGSLPDDLSQFSALLELNVSQNGLKALPTGICALSSLATLNISRNELMGILFE